MTFYSLYYQQNRTLKVNNISCQDKRWNHAMYAIYIIKKTRIDFLNFQAFHDWYGRYLNARQDISKAYSSKMCDDGKLCNQRDISRVKSI